MCSWCMLLCACLSQNIDIFFVSLLPSEWADQSNPVLSIWHVASLPWQPYIALHYYGIMHWDYMHLHCVYSKILRLFWVEVQKRRCACADLRVNSTGCRVTVTVLPPARV